MFFLLKSRGEIQMGLELMLQNGQLCVQQQIKALLKHPPQTAGIPAPVIGKQFTLYIYTFQRRDYAKRNITEIDKICSTCSSLDLSQ